MMRKLLLLFVLLSALSPHRVYGQYVWVSQDNNTHYVDVEFRINLSNPVLLTSEHQPALTYLSMVIDTYRDKIKSGQWKVWVESYVQQPDWSIGQNRAVAKVTSNVVKSYMIYAGGLKEEYFTTKNYSGTLDKRQGITSVIIGERYPLDRMLPMQQIHWEASDLAWLTNVARNDPKVQVTVGIPPKNSMLGTDTIQIQLPDFEALTFSYRHSVDSEWKQRSATEATQDFLPDWNETSTNNNMAVWGLADQVADGTHLGALENPLVAVLYSASERGSATKISASLNAEALAEIGAMIEDNRAALKEGKSFIFVDSYVYGDSLAPASARAQARIQSNTLKSHLIAHYGVGESQFSTRNHSGLLDDQSNLSVVTIAAKQPTNYMNGLQAVDLPANDGSWRAGSAYTKYSNAYAAQENAQMEFVNQKLSGLDLNALTAPWSAARMQDVAGFVDGAPVAEHGSMSPTKSNIGVTSLGTLGSIIADNTPTEKQSKRKKQTDLNAADIGVGVALGATAGSDRSATPPRTKRFSGKRNTEGMTAVVDQDGKISIDATAFQRQMTAETQAKLANENRAMHQAEERAIRESQAYQRRQVAVQAQKAKGRFAVFGVGINALSSVALIPSMQIDAYFSDRFSAIVEGYYSKWNFSEHNQFNMEMISPELRYFPLGRAKQFTKLYVGVYGAIGNYNLRWNGSQTGTQSNFWSVGLSAGYVLPLGNTPLFLDMGIAAGYVCESVNRYLVHQNDNYFLEHYNNATFFPVKAKISIVCRIFNERRR